LDGGVRQEEVAAGGAPTGSRSNTRPPPTSCRSGRRRTSTDRARRGLELFRRICSAGAGHEYTLAVQSSIAVARVRLHVAAAYGRVDVVTRGRSRFARRGGVRFTAQLADGVRAVFLIRARAAADAAARRIAFECRAVPNAAAASARVATRWHGRAVRAIAHRWRPSARAPCARSRAAGARTAAADSAAHAGRRRAACRARVACSAHGTAGAVSDGAPRAPGE
jgi:hypothetical protein